MSALNPGDTRTFTLTEVQAAEVIESLEDRLSELSENQEARDLHTVAEIAYFERTSAEVRAIIAIIGGDS